MARKQTLVWRVWFTDYETATDTLWDTVAEPEGLAADVAHMNAMIGRMEGQTAPPGFAFYWIEGPFAVDVVPTGPARGMNGNTPARGPDGRPAYLPAPAHPHD